MAKHHLTKHEEHEDGEHSHKHGHAHHKKMHAHHMKEAKMHEKHMHKSAKGPTAKKEPMAHKSHHRSKHKEK